MHLQTQVQTGLGNALGGMRQNSNRKEIEAFSCCMLPVIFKCGTHALSIRHGPISVLAGCPITLRFTPIVCKHRQYNVLKNAYRLYKKMCI